MLRFLLFFTKRSPPIFSYGITPFYEKKRRLQGAFFRWCISWCIHRLVGVLKKQLVYQLVYRWIKDLVKNWAGLVKERRRFAENKPKISR